MAALDDWYSVSKFLHILGFVAWMAGLFYLPRLFVYHSQAAKGSDLSRTFAVMERRLVRAIMRPAAVVTWLAGIMLLATYGNPWNWPGWLVVKVCLVFGMTAFHGACEHYSSCFANDRRVGSERFFRVFNEVPTLLLIGIVAMVIFRPF